ncbi:restriction endonuclease subunit S [Thalassotalea piscium]|uniref:restriction endonuclease subunit S n=1 Tax=Thalassotalea piscium TaxID=1230533 RepID=UPI00161CF241|nr:restriction endonuclease subunit S [Thalassotalea piscium]
MYNTVKTLKIIAQNGKFFRGKIKEDKNGENFVIQLRDIVKNERGDYLDLKNLLRTNISTKGHIEYLKAGDVLITVKGAKKYAFHLEKVPSKTVVSQHFLILRSPDPKIILPEFIEYAVNSSRCQNWFARKCPGSYQSTLSRETLERLPLPVLPPEEQQKIVNLIRETRAEKKLLLDLIDNREQQLKALANKLINTDY